VRFLQFSPTLRHWDRGCKTQTPHIFRFTKPKIGLQPTIHATSASLQDCSHDHCESPRSSLLILVLKLVRVTQSVSAQIPRKLELSKENVQIKSCWSRDLHHWRVLDYDWKLFGRSLDTDLGPSFSSFSTFFPSLSSSSITSSYGDFFLLPSNVCLHLGSKMQHIPEFRTTSQKNPQKICQSALNLKFLGIIFI